MRRNILPFIAGAIAAVAIMSIWARTYSDSFSTIMLPLKSVTVTPTEESVRKYPTPKTPFNPLDYKSIDVRELVSYADTHFGETIQISGKVFNIIGEYDFQMFVGDNNDAVYVTLMLPLSGIYKDDVVTIYGTVGGYASGKNSYGAEVRQPLLVYSIIKEY